MHPPPRGCVSSYIFLWSVPNPTPPILGEGNQMYPLPGRGGGGVARSNDISSPLDIPIDTWSVLGRAESGVLTTLGFIQHLIPHGGPYPHNAHPRRTGPKCSPHHGVAFTTTVIPPWHLYPQTARSIPRRLRCVRCGELLAKKRACASLSPVQQWGDLGDSAGRVLHSNHSSSSLALCDPTRPV